MYRNNFGDTTLKSKIDEITDALKEITTGYGDDEKIFELGIELGKFLSTSGTEFTRLSYFLEQEQEREKESRIRETIKK